MLLTGVLMSNKVFDMSYKKVFQLLIDKAIRKVYIPPCTLSVFAKAYNKGNNLSLNAWTQKDADAYTMDIEQKLNFYYTK